MVQVLAQPPDSTALYQYLPATDQQHARPEPSRTSTQAQPWIHRWHPVLLIASIGANALVSCSILSWLTSLL